MSIERAEWFENFHEKFKDDPEYRLHGLKFEIGEEICKQLRIAGMSRSDLAEKLGTSRAYITKILNGNSNFTLASLDRIAAAIGCNLGIRFCPEGFTIPKLSIATGNSAPKTFPSLNNFNEISCPRGKTSIMEPDDEINHAA